MDRPNLDALPWIFRHGEHAWHLLIIAGALLAIGWAWRRRRRAGRQRIAQVLAAQATPPSLWSDGTEVTVRGVLHVEPARVHSVSAVGMIAGREQTQHGDRAWPGAWLAVDDRRLELDGPIAVIAGSAATRRGTPPAAYFDQAIRARDRVAAARLVDRWRGPILGFHVRTVVDGDRIAARGVLVRSAAAIEQGYREGEGRWTLAPAHGIIEVAALAPVLDAPRLPVLTIIGHGLAGGLGTLAVLVAFSLVGPRPSLSDSTLSTPQAVIAVLGLHQHDVLHDLELALEDAGDPIAVQTVAGAMVAREGPCAAVEVFEAHGRRDAALAEARRCGDVSGELRVLIELGRYDEAATIARDRPELDGAQLVNLVAGNGIAAATPIMRAYAGDLDVILAMDEGAVVGRVGHVTCIALAAYRRDEPAAQFGLEQLALRGSPTCLALAAEHPSVDDGRLTGLDELLRRQPSSPLLAERSYLAGLTRSWPRDPGADAFVDPSLHPELPARAAAALLVEHGEPLNSQDAHDSRVRVIIGAIALALIADDRRELDRRLAVLSAIDATAADNVAAAIALRSPEHVLHDPTVDGDRLRHDWRLTGLPGDQRLWNGLRAASIETRPALATWLAYRPRHRPELQPMALAWEAAFERDLARAVGDDEAAARWHAIAIAHLTVATRPDLMVILEAMAETEALR